jgi:diacylglycerol kinase (ATP)
MEAMREPEREPQRRPAFRLEPRPPLAAFVLGFQFAWNGLVASAIHCRNMRVHLVLGVLASAFAAIAPLGGAERAILLLFVALVPAAESANTALEALVDLVSPEWSAGARVAKDAAAGAVLLLAVGSVAAFVAVAGPALPELWADRRAFAAPALCGAGAGLAAAALVAVGRRPVAMDLAATGGGLALLALLAASGAAPAGVLAAAALLAVSAGAAWRRRRPLPAHA